jgi:hypothetical protein
MGGWRMADEGDKEIFLIGTIEKSLSFSCLGERFFALFFFVS